jgi:hypothetical protein
MVEANQQEHGTGVRTSVRTTLENPDRGLTGEMKASLLRRIQKATNTWIDAFETDKVMRILYAQLMV